MIIRVVDNNTKTVLAQGKTNEFAEAMVFYIDVYRRQFTNAKVEWYYGNTTEGKPVSVYPTFH